MTGITVWEDDSFSNLQVFPLTERNRRYLLETIVKASRSSMTETQTLRTR